MKTKIFMNNESGGMTALLSVIILSTVMVVSLTATYTYLQNQSRYQAFVKANYKMSFVMQDMGQAVLQAYQQQQSGNCPAGTSTQYLDCTQVCMPQASFYKTNGNTLPADVTDTTNAICVTANSMNQNINSATLFCAYNSAADGGNGASLPAYCGGIQSAEQIPMLPTSKVFAHRNKLEKWYARLDKFFDTTARQVPAANAKLADALGVPEVQPPRMWSWLIPEKAYADYSMPTQLAGKTPTTENTQTHQGSTTITMGALNCGSANKMSNSISCQSCGKVQREGQCVGGTGGTCFVAGATCVANGGTCKAPTCLDLAICPPWLDAATCRDQIQAAASPGSHYVDPRIHRVITLNQ